MMRYLHTLKWDVLRSGLFVWSQGGCPEQGGQDIALGHFDIGLGVKMGGLIS